MIRHSQNALADVTTVAAERGLRVHHVVESVSDFGERVSRMRLESVSGGMTSRRMSEAALSIPRALATVGWQAKLTVFADEAPVVEVLITNEDT